MDRGVRAGRQRGELMAFEPITFVNGETLITAARLRHIDSQYDEAAAYINQNMRQANNKALRAQVAASAPTGAAGRFYFNSTDGKMYGHDGVSWGAWV